jgi:SAM-dependent methyltransferase
MTEGVWAARRTSFGDAADNYAFGRPTYPIEAIEWALPSDAKTVIDVGAGTGLLTARLLELGLEVTAIEPSDGMRAHIPTGATALAGSAESLALPDASVDAMFVGQAWHWFDIPAALAEAARVIRPGGTLALMWNLLDVSDPNILLLADLIDAEERTDDAPDDLRAPFEATTEFPNPEVQITNGLESYNLDRVTAYAFSRSAVIIKSDDQRAELAEKLRVGMPPGEFPIYRQTECWRTVRA